MARPATLFVCQSCGSSHNKWAGKCDACGEWNTIVEEIVASLPPQGLGKTKGRVIEFAPLSGVSEFQPRRKCGIEEFDRVSGGGLVAGSALLIGGDPGIGKSTILLQAVARLSGSAKCAYISGEESIDQVRMRARRLGLAEATVHLASATSVRDIISTMDKENFDVVVIDSIQTMYLDNLDSAPGTVAQVRASAQELIRTAKRRGVASAEGESRAWISTSSGRVPSMPANTAVPLALPRRSARNRAEGLATSTRPPAVISNTPISSVGPKRFLTARRMRKVWPRSPSK